MDATQPVDVILKEWRRLTGAEAEAIQLGAWESLAKHQADKLTLQPVLNAAMELFRVRFVDSSPEIHSLRDEFKRLVALEEENSQLLVSQKKALQESKNSLQQSTLNLRRVHHSYSSRPQPAWHSYS